MSNQIPAKRPQITKAQFLDKLMTAHPDFEMPDFFTAGIRGYYKDSMGKKGANDRAIYDDAMFVIGKDTNDFFAFNANTDPSVWKFSVASLKPGIYPVYKFDVHRGVHAQYPALCQRAGNVTIIRDGKGEETGMFGINQHQGGVWGTSSLGCQTVPPAQYPEFFSKASQMAEKYYGADYKHETYTYVLLEN